MTCHVLGQIHCVSVKSLNRLNKTGELVEKCGEDTVACHVLGQTHCVSVKSLKWFNKKGEMEKSVVKIQWPVTSLDRHTV